MENIDILDRIFNNFEKLVDVYEDLPETEEAEDRFWEYLEENILKDVNNNDRFKLEKALYDAGYQRERQGFFYGFNYAVKLFGKDVTE